VSWAYTHTERVRCGDLDAMKHLNDVVFLRYFETPRINHLNSVMDSHDPVHRVSPARPRRLRDESGRTMPIPDALKERLR
jgi:hypothetical protein